MDTNSLIIAFISTGQVLLGTAWAYGQEQNWHTKILNIVAALKDTKSMLSTQTKHLDIWLEQLFPEDTGESYAYLLA